MIGYSHLIIFQKRLSKIFFRNLLGLVTYLEWIMILVTIGSCMFMLTETPTKRIDNTPKLLYAEYAFVICMSVELLLKVNFT